VHHRVDERRWRIWAIVVVPLLLHLLVSTVTLAFILGYVDGTLFGETKRRSSLMQVDRSTLVGPYILLQSDIVTILSSLIVVSRFLAAIWTAGTAWRCTFLLLETSGATLAEIHSVLGWNLLFPFRIPFLKGRKPASQRAILVSIILGLAFPCQLSGPIMTGSITWSAHSRTIPSSIPVTEVASVVNAQGWRRVSDYSRYIEDASLFAHIFALKTYPSQFDWGKLRRYQHSAIYLEPGSILKNITLPVISLKSVQWIKDPRTDLRFNETSLRLLPDNVRWAQGMFAPVPNHWQLLLNDQIDRPKATPSSVLEQRLVVGSIGSTFEGDDTLEKECGFTLSAPPQESLVPLILRETTSTPNARICFVFAWITLEAGSAECIDCSLSLEGVAQSDVELAARPDLVAADILDNMAPMIAEMFKVIVAVPANKEEAFETYLSELLLRSYSATWSAFTQVAGSSSEYGGERLSTRVEIISRGLRAHASYWRAWLWFGLNLMVTISGLSFIVLQLASSQPLVSSPPLAALFLDSSAVVHKDNRALCNFSSRTLGDHVIGRFRLRVDSEGHRSLIAEDG
jgi:hypothetical protein